MKTFLSNFGAAIFIGAGMLLLCVFNLWAYSFPFQLDGFLGTGNMIFFVYNPLAVAILYFVGLRLMVPCAKKILNKNASAVYLITASLAVIAIFVYYIIMMVAGIKDFNATHEERHGFYITMQIIGACWFLIISAISVLRPALLVAQEAKAEELK